MNRDKLLFTPGPLGTSRTVKEAMLRDVGSRESEFIEIVRGVRDDLLEIGGVSQEQGFEATTVEQIAERADIAPATFFNHFQSKGGILALMTSEVVDYLSETVARHLETSGTFRDLQGTTRRIRAVAQSDV